MDQVARQQFLGTPRNDEEFRAAVRRELLTEELLSLPQTVTALSGDAVALVETTRNLSQTSVAGFEKIGREVAQRKGEPPRPHGRGFWAAWPEPVGPEPVGHFTPRRA